MALRHRGDLVGTSPVDYTVSDSGALVYNDSTRHVVYVGGFLGSSTSPTYVTPQNGIPLRPGETLSVPVGGGSTRMSLVAEVEDVPVRVVYNS